MDRRAALFTIAATAAVRAPARAQTLQPVSVVGAAVDQSGALFYAKELGLFERAGLDVTISTPVSNGIIPAAVSSNAVNVAYTNIVQIEQAFKKGLPIAVIAGAAVNDERRPVNFLLVGKDSPIKTAADLNGKTLGAETLKGLGDFSVDAWVDQHGGDSASLKWAEVPFTTMGEAIARGRIDGAFFVEPYASQVRSTTRVLGRPYEAIGKRFLGAAYITSTAWAAAHPDTVARFVRAIHDGSVWGNANPEKSALILQKYSHVDATVIGTMARALYAEALVPQEIQLTIDFFAKYKMIDGTFDARTLIYPPQKAAAVL